MGDTKRERWMNGRPTGGQREETMASKAQWGSMLGRGKRRGGGGKQGRGRQILGRGGRVGRERRANLKKIPSGNLSFLYKLEGKAPLRP